MSEQVALSLPDEPRNDHRPPHPTLPPPAGWPAPPAPAVYHELLGEIVTRSAPHTEADPVAILTQLLVAFVPPSAAAPGSPSRRPATTRISSCC
jgi:hypothetical protein